MAHRFVNIFSVFIRLSKKSIRLFILQYNPVCPGKIMSLPLTLSSKAPTSSFNDLLQFHAAIFRMVP